MMSPNLEGKTKLVTGAASCSCMMEAQAVADAMLLPSMPAAVTCQMLAVDFGENIQRGVRTRARRDN